MENKGKVTRNEGGEMRFLRSVARLTLRDQGRIENIREELPVAGWKTNKIIG
jgi:hypothetical protein